MPAERSTIRLGHHPAHRAGAAVPAELPVNRVPTKSRAWAVSRCPEPRTSARVVHLREPHASAWVVHPPELLASACARPHPDPRVSIRAVSRNHDDPDSLDQALVPGSPHQRPQVRLLVASQSQAAQCDWFARLISYICRAFVQVCTNASLVGILSGARLIFPACLSSGRSPNAVAWSSSQAVLAIASWSVRQAHPRAPPV